MATVEPKITLYTNHGCPFAQRAHIALKELDLKYEEIIIDLNTPREPWYLEVNPRGLVPSIKFSHGEINDVIITESAVVAQFLADLRPSHLLPASTASPLFRARVNFFVDTWNTKVSPFIFTVLRLDSLEEKESKCKEWAAVVRKEIEPLLADANPFFGGSKELTMAEVQVAPFLIRAYTLANDELLPNSLKDAFDGLPHFSRWAHAVIVRDSVTYTFDAKTIVETTASRIAQMKAKAK